MTDEGPLDDERQGYEEFARKYGEQAYRLWMEALYQRWERYNGELFWSQLKRPHLAVGVTPSRSLWRFKPRTVNGAPVMYLFNERLMFPGELDRKKEWVVNPWGKGHCDLVLDGLLCMTVQHYVFEVEGIDEKSYRHFGPRFEYHANRIAPVIGVPPVAHRRTHANAGLKLARSFPVGGREEGRYGTDVTQALIDLAAGGAAARTASLAVPPGLGIWDYVLFLLAQGKTKRLERLARNQARLLETMRKRRFPLRKAVEDGREGPDGAPITCEPTFNPRWLTCNNGIAGKMAEAIDACRTYHELPILADALEDAGCDDPHILKHLRAEMEHGGSCWVMKGLLRCCPANPAGAGPAS